KRIGLARRARQCGGRAPRLSGGVPYPRVAVPERQCLSQPRRDGTTRLRQRRVQILWVSASRDCRRTADGNVSTVDGSRESLEPGDGDRDALSARPRDIPQTLPRGRSVPANAVVAPEWRRG